MAQGDQVNLGPCEECCGGGEVPAPCECPAGLASSYTIPKFNFTYLAGGFWTCTVSGTIVINLTPSSECSWGKVYTDDNGHELVVVLWLEIGLIPNPPAVQVCKWVVEVSDADSSIHPESAAWEKTIGESPVGTYTLSSVGPEVGKGSAPATIAVTP